MRLALINPEGMILTPQEVFGTGAPPDADGSFLISLFNMWSGLSSALPIIAKLTPPEIHVDLLDENVSRLDLSVPYDLVGITAMTQQAKRAYEIADAYRAAGSKVILGGIHPSLLPDEAEEHADSVLVGECEETWPECVEDFRIGRLASRYQAERLFDLTAAPTPRYDLLEGAKYSTVWVQATRGCPRRCSFCAASNVYGTKYRHKTVDQVLREVCTARDLFHKQIGFADDNLFADRGYAYDLVSALTETNVRWFAQTDVSIAEDEKLLALLRKAGCAMVFVGFESLSSGGLATMERGGWKSARVPKYSEYVQKIQSFGIGVMGAFIFGLDTDDPSIFDETAEFVVSNKMYACQFTILTPLPGTRLREEMDRQGRITSNDWERYSFLNVNFQPRNMSADQLREGTLKAYRVAYSIGARLEVARHFKQIIRELQQEEPR